MRFDPCRQPRQPFQMLVTKHPHLPGKPLTPRLHMRRTSHGQPEPALGPHNETPILIVGHDAIRMALLIGQRCQHETVFHHRPARHRERLKQFGRGKGHVELRYV